MNWITEIYNNITGPFILTWKIIVIAVIYALIRAKHDSYISNGKWKVWAFLEGLFFALIIGYLLGSSLLDYIFIPIIFAFWFWTVFDMACGWLRAKKIFYFGSGKFDQKMNRIFITGFGYFVFKIIWLFIISGAYFSLKKQ